MREQEFKTYLEGLKDPKDKTKDRLQGNTITSYITDSRKVETHDGLAQGGYDLDDEFKKDKLRSLLVRYAYGAQAVRNNRKNPTDLDIKQHSLYNSLQSHRSAIRHYGRFCEQNSP